MKNLKRLVSLAKGISKGNIYGEEEDPDVATDKILQAEADKQPKVGRHKFNVSTKGPKQCTNCGTKWSLNMDKKCNGNQ